jgi:HYR domain
VNAVNLLMRRAFFLLFLIAATPLFGLVPELVEVRPKSFPVGTQERYMSVGGNRITVNTLFRITGNYRVFELYPLTVSTYYSYVTGGLHEFAQLWIPTEVSSNTGIYTVVASNEEGAWSNAVQFEVTGPRPPELYVPPMGVTAEATGPEGAIVTYAYQSNVADVECDVPTGSLFPLGDTTVTCIAHDWQHDEHVSRSFTVAVVDRTPPDMTIPHEILVERTSAEGRYVTWEAHATDIVDGEVDVECQPPSGSFFRLGTTQVNCSAVDAHHNAAIRSFNVTVVDNTTPTLVLPDDITTPATSEYGATVFFEATATDDRERSIPVTCEPPSGSTFAVGTTVVRCRATDDAERTSTGTFEITVTANPPALTLPDDITTPATSNDGAVVEFTATAHDDLDGELPTTCKPASGSTFAIGTTTVHCMATNSRTQSTFDTFTVTVTEKDPGAAPVLTVPDGITAEATSPHGALVSYSVTAQDEEDGAIVPACAPASGSTFPIGTTTVTCTATDSDGQSAAATFDVHVVDTMPPAILTISASPDRLWPVNRKLVTVTVNVTFSDDADPSATWKIVEVRFNEPVTPDDWAIIGDHTVELRAERNGDERDRVYTIVAEVTDISGNRSQGTVTVAVPHDNASGSGSTIPAPVKKRPARRG